MVEMAYEAEKKGYDAFIIGCASDMGLGEARSLVGIPVVAPTESATLLACTSGSAFLTAQGIGRVDEAPIVDIIAAEIKMAEIMVDLKRAYGTSVCPASIYYPPPPGWEQDIPITTD